MPHVAFKCPDPAMWSMPAMEIVKTVPIQDCLDCSLKRIDRACAYDYADLNARIEGGYDEMFSPSRFNGCDRELYLAAKYDYVTDPAEQTARVRGTAAHSLLDSKDPRAISEARVYRSLAGAVDHLGAPAVVSVQPDVVYPPMGLIADFKTWKYLPRGNVNRGEVDPQPIKRAYVRQLSVGAWAWANPLKVKYPPSDGFPSGRIDLHPAPVVIKTGQVSLRDGHSFLRQVVDLEDFTVLEEWMRSRVLNLNATRSGTEPGYCAPQEDGARPFCGTCKVRELCGIPRELYAKPKKSKAPVGRSRVNP